MLGIVERRNDARRLVKRIVERRRGGFDALAVDFDAVSGGVGLRAELASPLRR